ncbi:MAG: MOSC domain-containing protein [Burkholderiaceae bacterium]|nr:MAG: MOSC domain-containing protein [Burkholderiaceae bacterium]TBR75240.1 MAG: MOSC domain-containing protein [Burkholderiaceae bacterium]
MLLPNYANLSHADARDPAGVVEAVSVSQTHAFSKTPRQSITLLVGLGVEGDAHCGERVQHRSRVARNPDQPNLRQVHLLHTELRQELAATGYVIGPGEIGENITTQELALLELPVGTRLHLGKTAVVQLTDLRNPCVQLNQFKSGLMAAVLDRDKNGKLIRKAGVMGIVLEGGAVCPGDSIRAVLPPQPHVPLECV